MRAEVKPIINFRSGAVVCEHVVIAERPWERMKGLLGRRRLERWEGVLLRPEPSIHTAFMRFSIDVLFLDHDLEVVDIVEAMPPWRIAGRRNARAVLELAAGEAARRGIGVGDRLAVGDIGPARSYSRNGGAVEDREGAIRDAKLQFMPRVENGAFTGDRLDPNHEFPLRVLLIARDRRFRTVASTLLTRRGCAVETSANANDVPGLVERTHADVVVVDAGAQLTAAARTVATVMALTPSVGVVLVADEAEVGLHNLPVLAKWGPFDDFYAAIGQADRSRSQRTTLAG